MGTELVVPIACTITVPIFPAKKKQIIWPEYSHIEAVNIKKYGNHWPAIIRVRMGSFPKYITLRLFVTTLKIQVWVQWWSSRGILRLDNIVLLGQTQVTHLGRGGSGCSGCLIHTALIAGSTDWPGVFQLILCFTLMRFLNHLSPQSVWSA